MSNRQELELKYKGITDAAWSIINLSKNAEVIKAHTESMLDCLEIIMDSADRSTFDLDTCWISAHWIGVGKLFNDNPYLLETSAKFLNNIMECALENDNESGIPLKVLFTLSDYLNPNDQSVSEAVMMSDIYHLAFTTDKYTNTLQRLGLYVYPPNLHSHQFYFPETRNLFKERVAKLTTSVTNLFIK